MPDHELTHPRDPVVDNLGYDHCDPLPPEAFAPPSLTSFIDPLPLRVTPLGGRIVICVAPSRRIPDR